MNVFTLVHVIITLIALLAGLVVLGGWISGVGFRNWTWVFLSFTALTSVTGFLFPFHGITPAIVVGILSLILLSVSVYSLVRLKLSGRARKVYVVTAHTALYFNFFVLVAQLFQHIPALVELAPHQAGPFFGATQGLIFILFLGLGIGAYRNFGSGAESAR
jgi:hypothetical protein